MTLWEFLLSQGQMPAQAQDPRNQAPGMGSTANAMPAPPNPYSMQAEGDANWARAFRAAQAASGAIGAGSLMMGDVPGALIGGAGTYVAGNLAGDYDRRAKANKYQGN